MTYLAYLDEFGHIGPYVSKDDPKHRTSPVFGFAGFVLPAEEVRGFGTWFFQRKCQLLDAEIQRSRKHPAFWEKKGSSLYTVRNVLRYPELRRFTHRLFNKIERLGGFIFYVGIKKTAPPAEHYPNKLYERVFPLGKPPLSNNPGSRLDCRAGRTFGSELGRFGGLCRKRRLSQIF